MRLLGTVFVGVFVGFSLTFQDAWAVTTLKKIDVQSGSRVELQFDQALNRKQVQIEYLRDVIQLSLSDVSVYPAKIQTVQGREFTKIFAYQYSPKVVRFRMTVRGLAEKYQGKLKLKPKGKLLSVQLGEGVSDQIIQTASAPMPVTSEEKALLDRVMKEAPPQPQPTQTAIAKESPKASAQKARTPLAGGKSLINPLKVFWMFLLVLVVFVCCAVVFFKLRNRGATNRKGISKVLGKFAQLGFYKNGKMIEVVASHALGPKKSIVVVRISGKQLVLGVANDSISLISQFQGDVQSHDENSEPSQDGPDFSILEEKPAKTDSVAGAPTPAFFDLLHTESAKPEAGVRARILSRLEGLKRL